MLVEPKLFKFFFITRIEINMVVLHLITIVMVMVMVLEFVKRIESVVERSWS